jgi:hypothetical protein
MIEVITHSSIAVVVEMRSEWPTSAGLG